ncbi:MAG: magnesium transporter [Myxococcota bacterium]
MRLSTLLGPDLRATIESDPAGLLDALEEFHAEDIAELIESLPDADAIQLMRLLPAELGADIIERVESDRRETILRSFNKERRVELLAEMDPDDRVDVIQEFSDPSYAAKVLGEISEADPEVGEETRELVAWAPETAGGIMTTQFVALEPETKGWEAIEHLRGVGQRDEAETLYYMYVCGYGQKILGVVSLRDLILADPGARLSELMTEKVVRVRPEDDQEQVARIIARYDLAALPVVDENGVMLGVCTVDDVVDVVIEEATEDAQKMGGVVPLEDSYFATGLVEFIWKRATWLVVLFFGQLLTASVMEANEKTLRLVLELAVFIPLIIASGGNAGAQSSSLIIRALAVGEIRPKDWLSVLAREVVIGCCIGMTLGAIGFLRAFLLGQAIDPTSIALVVGLSIVCIVALGTVLGSLLPMLIKRLGLDPAVSSTPFIASLIDVLGLLVYFALARAIMHH